MHGSFVDSLFSKKHWPSVHRLHFLLGEQGRFEEALKDYTAAIQLNPRHCRAFYNRAFSNDRLRRYDAAVSDYTRALEIQPGNATAYHNRASLFERLGRLVLPLGIGLA